MGYILWGKKYCKKCGVSKALSEFYTSKMTKDGTLAHCKSCHNLYCKKRYDKKKVEQSTISVDSDLY